MGFVRVLGLIALAKVVLTSPLPQGLDMDFVEDQPPAPSPTIVIGAAAQVVTVNSAALVASVVQAVTASPLATLSASTKLKRQNTCVGGTTQPSGSGPVTTPDDADTFTANPAYSGPALSAITPPGYDLVYQNLKASSIAYGYLGYTTLGFYDVATCAARCNAISGCQSFNVYYERDPSVDPGSGTGCQNPPSTTNIKCAYWGSPLTVASATNNGQYRASFHVVIAGSNAYSKTTVQPPVGYTDPIYLNDATINAPLDCKGHNSYLGVRYFNSGPFDINLCAAACTAQSNYNKDHPPATGGPQMCNFFATYLLYKNGVPQGQYCALYDETWTPAYATNRGQYDSAGNHYTIGSSYIDSNAATPNPAC